MTTLVELNNEKHQSLKVHPHAGLEFAATQHLLNIQVTEIAQTICDFPVFLNKNIQSGYWNLSAITSFEMGNNLLVDENNWQATYRPNCMQTYPFQLMNSPQVENAYTIGFDEKNPTLSHDTGVTLFEENGKASPYLKQIKKLLESNIQHDIQTFKFGQKLDELGLCKSINIVVNIKGEVPQTLTGLYTIDEDRLHSLPDEQLGELNRLGYLAQIHGILLSISQLNSLIKKNNKQQDITHIENLKLEVNKT